MRRFEKCTCKCVVYTGMNKSYYEGIAWRMYSYDLFIPVAYIYLKKNRNSEVNPPQSPKARKNFEGKHSESKY